MNWDAFDELGCFRWYTEKSRLGVRSEDFAEQSSTNETLLKKVLTECAGL